MSQTPEQVDQTAEEPLPRNVKVLGWVSFLNDVASEMIFPLLPQFLPYYTDLDRRRLEVPPGMTGWQQVHGAARHTWRERVALDVWYVDHRSLALDLWILLLTVGVVVRADTVYAEDGSQRSGLPDAYLALGRRSCATPEGGPAPGPERRP